MRQVVKTVLAMLCIGVAALLATMAAMALFNLPVQLLYMLME